ncbi:MAG: guanylate kinase [Candidatus Omnitrophica bacterium CG_4_9_14_0_2_um_filter_42_8]|nr:MAG: guanylate kinase [Candidatus Omnitrophica bacterium CG22_combo_CG10-13_8_21_14_all_43_16]PJC48645.1 MAG: guanylate kinase [Candidatus Omnitrophica bacterium CG_4_9_14_0_2_um_filter_42_8]
MMKKKGTLFIISAPSGSGKTTLCTRLVESVDSLCRSISMTTRAPRPGEKDGMDYIFIEKPEFLKRQKRKEFLEWAKVFEEYYGTPKKHILHMLKRGSDVLLSIDVQGAMKIKRLGLDAVNIFILPPSLAMLKERLVNRSTDSRQAIRQRLNIARKEIACSRKYDYIIVNNRLESALDNLRAIIIAERCKTERS